ncbi:MAG: hypothetical protein K9L26_04510 [Candidatus Izimaplasma sp.]|nr:hypothetical protein [Candidatus Izimaplasma bacterium]
MKTQLGVFALKKVHKIDRSFIEYCKSDASLNGFMLNQAQIYNTEELESFIILNESKTNVGYISVSENILRRYQVKNIIVCDKSNIIKSLIATLDYLFGDEKAEEVSVQIPYRLSIIESFLKELGFISKAVHISTDCEKKDVGLIKEYIIDKNRYKV